MDMSVEEMCESVSQIINGLQEWDSEVCMIALELAHQLKEELELISD